jgi:hypothetical protein
MLYSDKSHQTEIKVILAYDDANGYRKKYISRKVAKGIDAKNAKINFADSADWIGSLDR